MIKHSLAVAASLAAAFPAMVTDTSQGEAKLRELVKGREAGASVRCLPLSQVRSSYVIAGTAIVYDGLGSRIWINRPVSGAVVLSSSDTLIIASQNGLLCDSDPIDLIDRSSRELNGFVVLGRFVPYDKAAILRPARPAKPRS